MKIGIVGSEGHVGRAMHALFVDAICYDLNLGSKEEINTCDTVFICVPTPQREDGSCNTDIVESVLQWINVPLIIIRSTVYVGFTDKMREKYNKEIVFQPEYYGETIDHPFSNLRNRNWLTFGGTSKGIHLAIKTYQTVHNSNISIYQGDAKSIEMAKYMENCFFATKVIFCNEMKDIADALGANYDVAREAWIADPRIGTSHTFVYDDNRGYDRSFKGSTVIPLTNKCIFFGHTPTSYISNESKIIKYKWDTSSSNTIRDYYKIHLDLGVWLHGVLGCFCVDTCEEFYIDKWSNI